MAFASAVICDSSPPSLPAARCPITSSSSSSSSWTALAILAVLPRLSVCQRTATLPLSHTPLAPSPYRDQRPSHLPNMPPLPLPPAQAARREEGGESREERQKRSARQGKARQGPHSTTHRCVFRYFITREALEGQCDGRVLHTQVPWLGAHRHSHSSRVCLGMTRVRAT